MHCCLTPLPTLNHSDISPSTWMAASWFKYKLSISRTRCLENLISIMIFHMVLWDRIGLGIGQAGSPSILDQYNQSEFLCSRRVTSMWIILWGVAGRDYSLQLACFLGRGLIACGICHFWIQGSVCLLFLSHLWWFLFLFFALKSPSMYIMSCLSVLSMASCSAS